MFQDERLTGEHIRAFRRDLHLSPKAFARLLRMEGDRAHDRIHDWEIEKDYRSPPAWLGLLMDLAYGSQDAMAWLRGAAAMYRAPAEDNR